MGRAFNASRALSEITRNAQPLSFIDTVRRALAGSIESLFHETRLGDFLLLLGDKPIRDALSHRLLERAIGVIYRPETERVSHYFGCRSNSML